MTIRCLLTCLFLLALLPMSLMPTVGAREIEYKYRQDLDTARFNVRELETKADTMEAWAAKNKDADPVTVGDDELNKYANAYNDALRKAQFAAEAIGKLPGDHPDVQEVVKRFQDVAGRIDATQSVFKKIYEAKQQATETTQYGDVQADVERLGEIARDYNNLQELFWNQPEKAAELAADFPAVVDEYKRIAEAYAPLLKSDTAEAKQLQNRLDYAGGRIKEFRQAEQQYLPFQIEKVNDTLNEVQTTINEAVAEQKPGYFGPDGGIEQQLGFAKTRIAVIAAIEPGREKAYLAKYDNLVQQSKEAQQVLRKTIVENNEGPADNYAGADRPQWLNAVRETWSKAHPDDKILAVRIPAQNWKRTTKWHWDGDAFVYVDYSRLQASVIVQENDTEAIAYPVDLSVDHQSNNQPKLSPWSKDDPPVQWTMLVRNVK